MFEKEQHLIEEKVKAYCTANDIALAELKWQPIPFSGEWGFATSFFQTAANEARAGKGNKVPVPQLAQAIAEQVKALPEHEREEFLLWLSDYELEHSDDWDKEIAQDSKPGGRLGNVLDRVRRDIAEGRTKPLDEVIDDS